mgnify:CR=1 FL=1
MLDFKVRNKWSKYLLTFLVLFTSCSRDVGNQQKKAEIISSFLDFYQKSILKKDSIILLDNASNYDYPNCLDNFLKDKRSNEFNKKDISKTKTFVWDKNEIPNAKLIKNSAIPDYRTPAGWRNFNKMYGEGYYVMSKPIVSNDLKYITFYIAYYCGDRCGYGQFALYKKTNNGWEIVEKYCDWIS